MSDTNKTTPVDIAALFAAVETRGIYFSLDRRPLSPSPLSPNNRMVWWCRCAAPQVFEVHADTAPGAIQKALDKAAEIENKGPLDDILPPIIADPTTIQPQGLDRE